MDVSESAVVKCEKIGEAMPDIAGIGILVGFAGQAFLSLVLSFWVVFLSKLGRLNFQYEDGTKEHEAEEKRLKLVSDILMVGNDAQMLTGISLLITAFSQYGISGSENRIDLYHLHLVFDTVSFVGVSSCAAFICWTFVTSKLPYNGIPASNISKKPKPRHITFSSARHRVTYVFAICFFVLMILLEVRLGDWDIESENLGDCFRDDLMTVWGSPQPRSAKVYVAVTGSWLLGVMFTALTSGTKLRKILLLLSSAQFPVHIYMMTALKVANQHHLEGEEGENSWDFGQTTATLLLTLTIAEAVRRGVEYWRFEKAIQNRAVPAEERETANPAVEEEGFASTKGLHPITNIQDGRPIDNVVTPANIRRNEMNEN